jgi:hypothetical protein
MTEKGNNLVAQLDLLMRLTKNVYGGGEIIYDDKAKALILSRYGLFYKYTKACNLSVEYSKVGDKQRVNCNVLHESSPSTTVGSTLSYDCAARKMEVDTGFKQ